MGGAAVGDGRGVVVGGVVGPGGSASGVVLLVAGLGLRVAAQTKPPPRASSANGRAKDMWDYPPHPELSTRVLDATVRPLDLNVIEEHAARQEPWLPHVRTRSDATQLELRGAITSEVLAVASAVLDDAETVAPFFAVPAERLALVDE